MAQAGSLKKNDALMINGVACRISSYTHSEPGKHGGSKVRFVTHPVFHPDKRVETFMPCRSSVEVPELTKTEMLCRGPRKGGWTGRASPWRLAMDGDEDALRGLRFEAVCDEGRVTRTGLEACSVDVSRTIVSKLMRGDNVLVSVWSHGPNTAVMSARSVPRPVGFTTPCGAAEEGGSSLSRKDQVRVHGGGGGDKAQPPIASPTAVGS